VLEEIELRLNVINDEGIDAFIEMLENHNITLKKMDFEGNINIKEEKLEVIK
jgi:hypothetical protein